MVHQIHEQRSSIIFSKKLLLELELEDWARFKTGTRVTITLFLNVFIIKMESFSEQFFLHFCLLKLLQFYFKMAWTIDDSDKSRR